MVINTSGTLGDAFIITLKMVDKGVTKINHHSFHNNIFPAIKEIYKLLGDVDVNTKKINRGDPILKKTIKGDIKNGESYTAFPEFESIDISKFDLPKKYSVIQLKSGIASGNQPWRKLNSNDIKSITGNIVLVGTDKETIKTKNKVYDLRNKTTLLESFEIIKNSKKFYGPQGLLSFLALSQAISSSIYLKSEEDRHAVRHRIDMIPEWKKRVTYK